jgi:hypothetical protein
VGDQHSVAVVCEDRYWQRPVGGTALFVIPGRESNSFTVTAFDSAGNTIATDTHTL